MTFARSACELSLARGVQSTPFQASTTCLVWTPPCHVWTFRHSKAKTNSLSSKRRRISGGGRDGRGGRRRSLIYCCFEIQKACPPRCCSRLVPPPARDRQCTAPWRQCPQTNLGQHMEASHQPWPPTDAMPANLGRPTLATDAMSTNSLHQPWPANNWPQACWPTLATGH